MKIKEKLANFKANFDAKFEKNKKTFYLWSSIWLCFSSYWILIQFYELKAFPKPLEYLYKVDGEVISSSHS